MRFFNRHEPQEEAHFLAAREFLDIGFNLFMGETHLRRHAARTAFGCAFGQGLRDMVEDRFAFGQFIQLVLREIANLKRRRSFAAARHERQTLCNRFHEGCLALTICADNGDAVIGVET